MHSFAMTVHRNFVQVEIIANNQGNRTTPSYVAFTSTEQLVGDPAKDQVWYAPLEIQSVTVHDVQDDVVFLFALITYDMCIKVTINPTNTIFHAKKLIGRKFADSTVQSDMKHWPFKVVDTDVKQ